MVDLTADDDAEVIDFDSAETFLQIARQAHQQGDQNRSLAARKMVMVALRLKEGPRGR